MADNLGDLHITEDLIEKPCFCFDETAKISNKAS